MSPAQIWRTMQPRRDLWQFWNNSMHDCTERGIVLAAILSCACALSPAGAAGLGAKYGTREPANCASTAAPDDGPPSAEQAAQYLKCTAEKESGQTLTLLEDVVVQVAAKGRPYNPGRESMPEIDTDQAIYALRGSFVRYQCSRPDPDIMQNVGKNCSSVDQPKAIGNCWKTTFGDWRCTMNDHDQYRMTPGQTPPQ